MNRLGPMIGAELLKLRRRKGLSWFSLFLVAGMVVVVNVVLVTYHATDPARYGPAGGETQFTNFFTLFSITVVLASVLVGATAGAQDVESGVFRSLVATGQSRVRLALVRIPGALLFLVPMVALGYLLEIAAAITLAGGTPIPDAASVLIGAGWLASVSVLTLAVSLGIAALLQSRATAIGVMIAWELAGARVVERIRVRRMAGAGVDGRHRPLPARRHRHGHAEPRRQHQRDARRRGGGGAGMDRGGGGPGGVAHPDAGRVSAAIAVG